MEASTPIFWILLILCNLWNTLKKIWSTAPVLFFMDFTLCTFIQYQAEVTPTCWITMLTESFSLPSIWAIIPIYFASPAALNHVCCFCCAACWSFIYSQAGITLSFYFSDPEGPLQAWERAPRLCYAAGKTGAPQTSQADRKCGRSFHIK